MTKIKIALVGVGNCASALIQGIQFYKEIDKNEDALGLRHLYLGGYHPSDLEFVCAFDIDDRKVGRDLSKAMFSPPNNTLKFADVPRLNVPVLKGPVLDGLGAYLKEIVKVSSSSDSDVTQELQNSKAEIVINLLPSGATKASQLYAQHALQAGCAFLNATPILIAGDPAWNKRFDNAGLPLVGDDLMDQVGATALHRTLLKLLSDRGVKISETYQLDVGGGTESLDTLERTRDVKRTMKTKSVETTLPYKASIVAGSTDYVDFLENRRDSFFWIQGLYFGRVPMRLDMRLGTVDAPNAGSVLLDAIRATKIAMDRGASGALLSVSAYAFKHPPRLLPLDEAERWFQEFISGKRER